MKILVFCPQWGQEKLPFEEFAGKVRDAGFDGVEMWMPDNADEKKRNLGLIRERGLHLIAHQWKAAGESFGEFKRTFEYQLNDCADAEPLLINSHTGTDHFTFTQNCELIELALRISDMRQITICHETHRGRFAYSPRVTMEFMNACPQMKLTADFSHWTNVTESYLEGFQPELEEAIRRTGHVHARIGNTQSSQVSDPKIEEWKTARETFIGWWQKIAAQNESAGSAALSFTTEFGPEPYMVNDPKTGKPLASQWEINCWMKDLIREKIR